MVAVFGLHQLEADRCGGDEREVPPSGHSSACGPIGRTASAVPSLCLSDLRLTVFGVVNERLPGVLWIAAPERGAVLLAAVDLVDEAVDV